MKEAAVLMSGGLDSTALAYYLLSGARRERDADLLTGVYKEKQEEVGIQPFFINYQQAMFPHEATAVKDVCLALAELFPNRVGRPLMLRLGHTGPSRLTRPSRLTKDTPFPYGTAHPAYVPCRDPLMLLTVASEIEHKGEYEEVYIGIHSTDTDNRFPDCNDKMISAVNLLLRVCMSRDNIRVVAPFLTWSKADIKEFVGEHCAKLGCLTFSGYGNALE